MTALNTHPDTKPQSAARLPRRRHRVGGEVNVAPLAISLATLLAIAWVVSFAHQDSSIYDSARHPDPPAAVAAAHP